MVQDSLFFTCFVQLAWHFLFRRPFKTCNRLLSDLRAMWRMRNADRGKCDT